MSLTKLLLPIRQKPTIEVRQHKYGAPLRPAKGNGQVSSYSRLAQAAPVGGQRAMVPWTRSPISRPVDFDEVTGNQHPSSDDVQETLKSYDI